MTQKFSRQQLLQTIHNMMAQSELFPESLEQQAPQLADEDLEKLVITLHVALESEKKLTDEEREKLDDKLARYFNQKQRIYQRAQRSWLQQQEAAHEAQESLFEESLLAQL